METTTKKRGERIIFGNRLRVGQKVIGTYYPYYNI